MKKKLKELTIQSFITEPSLIKGGTDQTDPRICVDTRTCDTGPKTWCTYA
ncbi:MAG: hypothetical protein WBB45_12185 [Cyclobacteriaceae bacterium]